MCRDPAAWRPFGMFGFSLWPWVRRAALAAIRPVSRKAAFGILWSALLVLPSTIQAVVLWSDLGATLAHETGAGSDILGGALKRDDSSSDTLYFKFHVDPLSDASTEEYFAAFELYEGGEERLGVGNALKAWAYSAFKAEGAGGPNKGSEYIDLHSSRPEPPSAGTSFIYENPHRGLEVTIVFKVQYVPGGDDRVTVWLNPDLGPGASEAAQPENLITRFNADASFDEIHLRHGGGGDGWIFSEMEIATSFSDLVSASGANPGGPSLAFGQGELPFSFRSWQREDGLPQNFVRALAQTLDGYLWIGSDDGVTRFDGLRFVSFGLPEGLPSGPVQALFGDSRGALWIGSAGGGLTRWQHGRFTTFTTRDGLPADSVTALAEDGEGRIWVGTESGLAVWDNGRLAPMGSAVELKGKSVTALFKDRRGTMWVGAAGAGVFQSQGGRFVPLKDSAVEGLLQDPHCLLVDHDGCVWIGAGNDFVLCGDGRRWRPYRIPGHVARRYVSALAEGPDGTVWAGSVSEGLVQFKGGKTEAVNASGGLSDHLVESLLVDRDGVLWVGTHGGLNRQRRKNLFAFGQKEGLGYGVVQGLAEITPGVIWAGKPSDGLYRWDGGNFRRLPAAGLSLGGPQVNSLLMARDGSCWVAGAHGLLHFKDPTSAANEAELFSLADLNVVSLGEDHDGGVWVGTREGQLWRRWQREWLAQTNYWQAHAISAIVQDKDGWMFIGTDGGGLLRFKGDSVARFDKSRGLLSDLICTLYLDAQGALWIGTAGGGLSRLRDGRIATFTSREGLPDNTISQVLEDNAGRLWLGSNRGIACVAKRDLEDLAARKVTAVYPQFYGRSEGMLSEECARGFFPAGLKTQSGLLWFSTLKGIVVVDPRPHAADTSLPSVVLEEALVDDIQLELPEAAAEPRRSTLEPADAFTHSPAHPLAGSLLPGLTIAPGKHRLELRYTGLNFDAPERVRFRFQLEGLDTDWVDVGTRRTAFYGYVPPGHYRFRVTACNSDGVWNQAGAGLALTVRRHFWQSGWFVGLGAVGLLFSVGAGVRFVEKRKLRLRLKRLEQERALEQERTRIAQDLHDEMGAKLCRISFLSEHARRGQHTLAEIDQQIASISEASRDVLHSLDEIVWAVNPQNDTLGRLASYIGQYAQDYFHETGIECELDIPAQLPAHTLSSQSRHHLFLAVHEALTNMLKHSGATRSKVSMVCHDSSFEIAVSDNGIGFNASVLGPGSATTAASGNGLRNMRQRLTDLGGACRVESEPGEGTTVRFIFSLNGKLPER